MPGLLHQHRTTLSSWIQYRGFLEFVFLSALYIPTAEPTSRLVDLTMRASFEPRSTDSSTPAELDLGQSPSDNSNLGDAERGLPIVPHSVPLSVRSLLSNNPEDETELRPTGASNSSSSLSGAYLKKKTSQIFEAVLNNGVVSLVAKQKQPLRDVPVAPALSSLVEAYAASDIAAGIKADGEELSREVMRADNGISQQQCGERGGNGTVTNELPDVVLETSMLRGRKRASWGTQFKILSGRAFKNLYRDPALLTAHYLSAVGLAGTCGFFSYTFRFDPPFFSVVICGLFYHNVTYVFSFQRPFLTVMLMRCAFSDDISGFQNRLGMFSFSHVGHYCLFI